MWERAEAALGVSAGDAEIFLELGGKAVDLFADFWGLFEEGGEHALQDLGIEFHQLGRGDNESQVAVDVVAQGGEFTIQLFDLLHGQSHGRGWHFHGETMGTGGRQCKPVSEIFAR